MKLYKANWVSMYVEATPEDVVTAFRELPQTTQMRAAADVLVEAEERYDPDGINPRSWAANRLRCFADRWDREDAELEERNNLIGKLENELRGLGLGGTFRSIAEALTDAGYRQQEAAPNE